MLITWQRRRFRNVGFFFFFFFFFLGDFTGSATRKLLLSVPTQQALLFAAAAVSVNGRHSRELPGQPVAAVDTFADM